MWFTVVRVTDAAQGIDCRNEPTRLILPRAISSWTASTDKPAAEEKLLLFEILRHVNTYIPKALAAAMDSIIIIRGIVMDVASSDIVSVKLSVWFSYSMVSGGRMK